MFIQIHLSIYLSMYLSNVNHCMCDHICDVRLYMYSYMSV